jgi:hypothetical protein
MVSADHDKEREILLDMEVKLRSGDALARLSVYFGMVLIFR